MALPINNAFGAGIVTVEYDGLTPWGEAVPYVSIEREPIFYGGKWGQVANITLSGQISQMSYDVSGNYAAANPTWIPTNTYPTGLKNLEKIRDDIIEVFSNSLRTFKFHDAGLQGGPGNNEMVFDNAVVESIDFPNSGYWGLLDFSITLKCYEQDYFMAQGIMNAVDEFQTTESANGTLNVSHRISARGVDYMDHNGDRQHGLNNAITWVDSRKGDQYKSTEGIYTSWWGGTNADPPTKLSGDINVTNNIDLILLSQEESINRLEGSYEVSETFIGYLDEGNRNSGKTFGKKFTVDINESLSADFNVVSVSGEYKGGKDTSLKELRDAFVNDGPVGSPNEPEKMLFEKAKFLSGFDGSPDPINPLINKPTLYEVPINFNVEENETEKVIRIKASFDTNPLFGSNRYFFDHKISVSMDDVKSVTKVSVDGTLLVRGLSVEKQFYLKKFLDGRDVMDFLWQHANEQHGLIGKTCWECKGGALADGTAIDYWIRTDIGDTRAEAVAVCNAHPYGGAPAADAAPDRCHELNRSASTISMIKNEVKNTLQLSATFDDEDTLRILVDNPDDGTCFQCLNGSIVVGIITADSIYEAELQCATGTVQECPAGDVDTGKDYGKASFSVDVKSPIDYVKANASAQEQYNGHWAIQKFGIKTREKSSIKVNLKFREDAGVPGALLEPTLRGQAHDIQTTLNSMLDQQDVYDVSESITHRETKGDNLAHALERSYAPDEANAICIDIAPIGTQKDCYVCSDGSGQIVNSSYLGDKIYAYNLTDAQELCDQLIGHEDVFGGGYIQAPLTPEACTMCWSCLDSYGVVIGQVLYDTQGEADTACENMGGIIAFECGEIGKLHCYICAGFEGINLYGPFSVIDSAVADEICELEVPGWSSDTNNIVMDCPEEVLECYSCMYDFGFGPESFGYVVSQHDAEAYLDCSAQSGGYILPDDPGLTLEQPCDFQSWTTTTAAPPREGGGAGGPGG